jgi:hypothetical protein
MEILDKKTSELAELEERFNEGDLQDFPHS